MNKAETKLYNFIKKNYENEKDKWSCGMKNNYYEWDDLFKNFEAIINSKERATQETSSLVNKLRAYEKVLEKYNLLGEVKE